MCKHDLLGSFSWQCETTEWSCVLCDNHFYIRFDKLIFVCRNYYDCLQISCKKYTVSKKADRKWFKFLKFPSDSAWVRRSWHSTHCQECLQSCSAYRMTSSSCHQQVFLKHLYLYFSICNSLSPPLTSPLKRKKIHRVDKIKKNVWTKLM